MIKLEILLSIVIGFIVLTQMIIPLALNKPMFFLFRKHNKVDATMRSAIEKKEMAEESLIAARIEEEAVTLENKTRDIHDNIINKIK